MKRSIQLVIAGLGVVIAVTAFGGLMLASAPTARADTTIINVCKATSLTQVNQAIADGTTGDLLALVDVKLKPLADLVVKVGDTVKVRDGVTLSDVLAKLKCRTTETTTETTTTEPTTETAAPRHRRHRSHSSWSSSSAPVTERPVGGAETGG